MYPILCQAAAKVNEAAAAAPPAHSDMADYLNVVVAGMALLVSCFAYWFARKTAIEEIRPVLVFTYDNKRGWILQNIGKGPALNIVIAQKKNECWFNPVRIPPLSANSEFILAWLDHVNDTGLGATYDNFQDRSYSSTCSKDLSRVFTKNKLRAWHNAEIGVHWDHPVYKTEDWPNPCG